MSVCPSIHISVKGFRRDRRTETIPAHLFEIHVFLKDHQIWISAWIFLLNLHARENILGKKSFVAVFLFGFGHLLPVDYIPRKRTAMLISLNFTAYINCIHMNLFRAASYILPEFFFHIREIGTKMIKRPLLGVMFWCRMNILRSLMPSSDEYHMVTHAWFRWISPGHSCLALINITWSLMLGSDKYQMVIHARL